MQPTPIMHISYSDTLTVGVVSDPKACSLQQSGYPSHGVVVYYITVVETLDYLTKRIQSCPHLLHTFTQATTPGQVCTVLVVTSSKIKLHVSHMYSKIKDKFIAVHVFSNIWRMHWAECYLQGLSYLNLYL